MTGRFGVGTITKRLRSNRSGELPVTEIATNASDYVMGHNDRERHRLSAQAAILAPITEQLLRRAGVGSGMRIVDFGCGVGDVSMIAARLVGTGGQVTGIDIDAAALSIARQRALEYELPNITFLQTNALEFRPDTPVDATVGRHILIHTAEPLALLRTSYSLLKPGGVAVFQEYDFSVVHLPYPSAPLWESVLGIFGEFFHRALRRPTGTQLYQLALAAGFCAVECRAEYPLDGGANSPYYEWIAESLRSILSRAEALGVIRGAELDMDTLAERLRREAVANGSCLPAPAMVGCIARKP